MLDPQRSFVGPLLAWHEENGRHRLPWRDPDRSAFEILIAEILLQRTTAASVAGAYLPIIARYPSPEAVVASRPDAIERRIAPLGLAKRAEFIHRCSHQLLARHSGDVPHRYADLLELHGVGAYTARSVLIHAFDKDIAAVDTNVRRLISRFFDVPPDSGTLAHLADALAPSRRGERFPARSAGLRGRRLYRPHPTMRNVPAPGTLPELRAHGLSDRVTNRSI